MTSLNTHTIFLKEEDTENNLNMRFSYENLNVINNNSDGYVNDTELCKSYYKDFKEYLKQDEWNQVVKKYEDVYKNIQFDSFENPPTLFYDETIKNETYTYVHPCLVTSIMKWCSEKGEESQNHYTVSHIVYLMNEITRENNPATKQACDSMISHGKLLRDNMDHLKKRVSDLESEVSQLVENVDWVLEPMLANMKKESLILGNINTSLKIRNDDLQLKSISNESLLEIPSNYKFIVKSISLEDEYKILQFYDYIYDEKILEEYIYRMYHSLPLNPNYNKILLNSLIKNIDDSIVISNNSIKIPSEKVQKAKIIINSVMTTLKN
jgi:hypothetical protein